MISVANALMSGVTPSFTFEKIYIGRVLPPGPDTKLAMTRSSRDSVKASS
jgi:putrescine transport system permease protein